MVVNCIGKLCRCSIKCAKYCSNLATIDFKGLRYAPEILGKSVSGIKKVAQIPIRSGSKVGFPGRGYFDIEKYSRRFSKSLQEMEDSLFCVSDRGLAQRLKSSGDMYTMEEISNIEELINNTNISVDKAIKCRGSERLLQMLDGNVKIESSSTIYHYLEDYVNRIMKFKAKDKENMGEITKKINKFINSKMGALTESVLYRGEQSETEITRLISLILEKQKNPDKVVKYGVDHLYSTTQDLRVLTHDYDYADKCFIKIIGVEGKCKGLNINEILGSKNKFFSQKEILLPSTSEFEVVDGCIQDGRLMVTLRFLS